MDDVREQLPPQPSQPKLVARPEQGLDEAPELAVRMLDRLDRIESLDRSGAPPAQLLDELRALVVDAEAWTRAEGGEAAGEAVERIRSALVREMIAV